MCDYVVRLCVSIMSMSLFGKLTKAKAIEPEQHLPNILLFLPERNEFYNMTVGNSRTEL